jgi:hypothetical protein
MNHNDPQLKDTPTAAEAAAPEQPCLINSKYRRLTLCGALFHAYLGMRILSGQDSLRSVETARSIR